MKSGKFKAVEVLNTLPEGHKEFVLSNLQPHASAEMCNDIEGAIFDAVKWPKGTEGYFYALIDWSNGEGDLPALPVKE